MDAAVDQLASRALVSVTTADDDGARRMAVTGSGCVLLSKMIRVRRTHLADAAAEWHTDETSAVTLRNDERVLVPDARQATD